MKTLLKLVLLTVVATLCCTTAVAAAATAVPVTVSIDSASHDVAGATPFMIGTTHLGALVGEFSGINDGSGTHHAADHLAITNWPPTRVVYAGLRITGGHVQSVTAYRASATHSVVYFGGTFTAVNGQTRHHLAALSIHVVAGRVIYALSSGWHPSSTVSVESMSVGAGHVYFPTGFGVAAVSLFAATPVWTTRADCGVHVVLYFSGYVYVGGLFISLGTLRLHGIGRVRASTGSVDHHYVHPLRSNSKTCHQAVTGLHDKGRYDGTNGWALTVCPDGKIAWGGAGIHNAFGIVGVFEKLLDGDGQTVSCGRYLYVGHHRSGGALTRWRWDWGSMGGIFSRITGKEIHWAYDNAFTGGYAANPDGRNGGSMTSFVAWGKLCIGGAFTSPRHGFDCVPAP